MNVEQYMDLYEQVMTRIGNDEIAQVIVDQVGKDSRVAAMRARNGSSSAGS